MNTNHKFLTLFFSGLLILPLSISAQGSGEDADDENAVQGVESEIEIGGYHLDDPSFRFGKYTGITDDGFEPLINFKFQSRNAWDDPDLVTWRLQGWRVGLDSMRLEFDYFDQGNQRFTATYQETPNNRFNDGMSPFNGIGTGNLSLPADWVSPANGTTSSFHALYPNLKPVVSRWDRKRLDLGFDKQVNRQWDFSIDWRHETKEGVKTFGAVIGNSGGNPRAVVLPAPMDWETDIMEAAFNFANSRYQFGFSLYASWFDNAQKSVTWDNPYGQRSGWAAGVGFPDGQGLYSLEPDNEAMQFRAYGAVNFNGSSRLSADVSFGSMKQDDPLFAYSVNPALNVHTALPRAAMDAKIDTTFANIRYTVQPTSRVNLLASYSLDDRDNKTARDEWIYIGGDSQDQKDHDDARINLPYSYEKEKIDLNATWRAAKGVRVKGGVEFVDYTRTYSEVLGSDESRYFAGVSLRRWEGASLSFDYASSDRDIDGYQGNRTLIFSHLPGHTDPDDFENLPALRKYNQTDRERDEYRFRADFFPTDAVNFAVAGSWYEDDYNEADNLFGLQESEVTIWTVDAGFYPREGISLTAYYTVETYDSLQTSRSWNSRTPGSPDNPERNWMADTKDDVDTWNLAVKFDGVGKNFGADRNVQFGVDWTYSNVECGHSACLEALMSTTTQQSGWQ
jgi:MtrB/PioB family decaheme-associated outer membrane protein